MGPTEPSPRNEAHDDDVDPFESRQSPAAMEVHQEADIISPDITLASQELVPSGREQTPQPLIRLTWQ